MMRIRYWKILLLMQSSLLLSAGAEASIVTLDFSVSFGDTPAPGSSWLTATFDDGGGSGVVNLTITAPNSLSSGSIDANITEIYFNIDDSFLPGDYSITSDPANSSVIGTPTISQGVNAFRAGGDGYFDIWIDIPTGDTAMRLEAGESIEFTITGTGLTAEHFYRLSDSEGLGEENPGPFYAAAHVQSTGIDGLGSDWVAAVPLPAALWLFTSSMVMFLVAARRRRYAPGAG